MSSVIAPALFTWVIMIVGALEDTKTLSVSAWPLQGAWVLLAVWDLAHGYWFPVLSQALILAWGLGFGASLWVWVLGMLVPYLPSTFIAAAVREKLFGEGDLMAVSAASLVSPAAGLSAVLGFLVWRALRGRRQLWTPAMPGFLLGVSAYIFVAFIFVSK